MKQELLTEVLLEMREYVDNGQLKQLEKVMRHILFHYHITKENTQNDTFKNDWIELFIAAKRIEGCSAKTLVYYRSVVDRYDILMDKYGDAGAVRYGIEGAFNVALGKISVHNSYHREYVRSFLESDGIYNYLHNSCMASTRASLNESNLAMLNIVIPNEHIVLEYEKLLRKIRDRILQDNDETARLIELRDWLLPMLMNGQATIDD